MPWEYRFNSPRASYALLLTLAVGLILSAGCQPSQPASPADSEPAPSTSAPTRSDSPTARSDDRASDDLDQEGVAADETANAHSAPATSPRDDSTEPVEIVFEDIQLPIQADIVFRPFMLTDRVKELDGKRIRIHGYMLPDSKTRGITQFVLLKNTECKFGPGGQADHLVNVLMVEGETAKFQDEPVTVEGILKVNPFQGPDGNTWSIYDLACDHVEDYQPRR